MIGETSTTQKRARWLLAAGAVAGLTAAAASLLGPSLRPHSLPDGAVARVNGTLVRAEEYERLLAALEALNRRGSHARARSPDRGGAARPARPRARSRALRSPRSRRPRLGRARLHRRGERRLLPERRRGPHLLRREPRLLRGAGAAVGASDIRRRRPSR